VTLPGPSLLFCPADRPDRYAKALATADAVVLDLEDGVAGDRKAEARRALVARQLDPDGVIVRVNAAGTAEQRKDLAALRETPYRTLMLPKAEHAEHVQELGGWQVLALCETPTGVLRCTELAAAANTVGLMWGAEDLAAALGARSSRGRDGAYRSFAVYARSSVLFAARAAGLVAVDAVDVRLDNLDALWREAADAAADGFTHKACIHPTHAAVVRTAFRPSEDEVEQARRVVAAAASAGVVTVAGRMIDAPLVRQAAETLRQSRSAADAGEST
jgi:citrate lyase subunit beta/citryl-CoA lyase